MLVYYYIMMGSCACILLYSGGFQCLCYDGGFQCLYITILWWVPVFVYYYIMMGSSACILLYDGGFQCLYITV